MSPRTVHASDHEYQPDAPPIPSITAHSTSGGASTSLDRSSTYSVPLAQSGSVGIGSLGTPATLAFDQWVATSASRIRTSARRIASSTPIKPVRRVGHPLGDVVLAAHDGVAEALDERPGQAARAPG